MGLKNWNQEKRPEKKEENSRELQKSNVETEVYDDKTCDWGKKSSKA